MIDLYLRRRVAIKKIQISHESLKQEKQKKGEHYEHLLVDAVVYDNISRWFSSRDPFIGVRVLLLIIDRIGGYSHGNGTWC